MIELVVSPWTLGLCLAGAVSYLGIRVLLRSMESAPEAYEDETGFHVTALPVREETRIWLQSHKAEGMMSECRLLSPHSVSSPTSKPVS